MSIYLVMIIGGFLGILIHAIVTMATINKNMQKATFKVVWRCYWAYDYWSFIISIAGFTALLYLSSEYVDLEKLDKINYSEPISERLLHFKVSNFIKTSSLVAGFFSDYIVYKFIGKAKKKLDALLNPVEDKP